MPEKVKAIHAGTQTSYLEVVTAYGRKITVHLSAASAVAGGAWLSWLYQDGGDHQDEWLSYVTWNGTHSKSRCSVVLGTETNGRDAFLFEFEHRDLASDAEDPEHKHSMMYTGWDGKPWIAQILTLVPPVNNTTPLFLVSRM